MVGTHFTDDNGVRNYPEALGLPRVSHFMDLKLGVGQCKFLISVNEKIRSCVLERKDQSLLTRVIEQG